MRYVEQFRGWLEGKAGDPATMIAEFRKFLEAAGEDLADVDDAELQAVLDEASSGGGGTEQKASVADYYRRRYAGNPDVQVEEVDGMVAMRRGGRLAVGDVPDDEMTEYAAGGSEQPAVRTKGWDESKHRRGQPGNPGQFGSGGGGRSGEGEAAAATAASEKDDEGEQQAQGGNQSRSSESSRQGGSEMSARNARKEFGSVRVLGGDQEAVEQALKSFFPNGDVKIEDLHALVGAPEDLKIDAEVMDWNGQPRLMLSMPPYSHDKFDDFGRSLMHDKDGTLVMHNDIFELQEHLRGPGKSGGLGTDTFVNEVNDCLAKGVGRIECGAARVDAEVPAGVTDPAQIAAAKAQGMVGYKVWPKLGYDGAIPFDKMHREAQKKGVQLPPCPVGDAKSLSELVDHPEGWKWWDEHGVSVDLSFDLSPGSKSVERLNGYLAKKGKDPVGKKAAVEPEKPKEEAKPMSRAERMLGRHTAAMQGLRDRKALIEEFEGWLEGKAGDDTVLTEEFLRTKGLPSAFPAKKEKASVKGKHGDEGHFVTIGAVDGHGGSVVFIKNGRIEKGAAGLKGKKIDDLDKHPGSTRKEGGGGKADGQRSATGGRTVRDDSGSGSGGSNGGNRKNSGDGGSAAVRADAGGNAAADHPVHEPPSREAAADAVRTADSTTADMGGSGGDAPPDKLDPQQAASPVEQNVPSEMIDKAGAKMPGEPDDGIPQSLEPGMGATTPPPEQEVSRALAPDPNAEPGAAPPPDRVPRALVPGDEAAARKIAAQEKAKRDKQQAAEKQASNEQFRKDAAAGRAAEKQAVFDRAAAAGISKEYVKARAAEYLKADRAHKERVNDLLKTVRSMTAREVKGGLNKLSKKQRELAGGNQNRNYQSLNAQSVKKAEAQGGGLAGFRGIDEIANDLSHEYADLLTAGNGDAVENLQAILIAGTQQPMSEQQALEEAVEHLEAEKDQGAGDVEYSPDYNPYGDDEVGAPSEEVSASGDQPNEGVDTSFDFGANEMGDDAAADSAQVEAQGGNAQRVQGAKRGAALKPAARLRGITGKALETAKWNHLIREHVMPLYGAERAAAVADRARAEVFMGRGTLAEVATAYHKALVETDSFTPPLWEAMGDGYRAMSTKRYGMEIAGRDDDEEEEIEKGKPIQYAVRGPGVYMPIGEHPRTVPTLPPGLYDARMSMSGDAIFKARTIHVDELITIDDSLADQVIEEIRAFWKKGDKFKKHGFLHRRGYILYGEPGCGKSAIVDQVIEGISGEGDVAFFCENPYSFMQCMEQFRETEPERPMVCVFEDMDSIIASYGDAALLQWLDGNHMVNRVVNIATTNYIERLGDRIVARPRRFDRVLKIEAPDARMRDVYFAHKVPELSTAERRRWVEATDGLPFAALTEVVISVLCLENDLEETVGRLNTMKRRGTLTSMR